MKVTSWMVNYMDKASNLMHMGIASLENLKTTKDTDGVELCLKVVTFSMDAGKMMSSFLERIGEDTAGNIVGQISDSRAHTDSVAIRAR